MTRWSDLRRYYAFHSPMDVDVPPVSIHAIEKLIGHKIQQPRVVIQALVSISAQSPVIY